MNPGIWDAIKHINERLDGLEYDAELIKAELNIQDTEDSKREKEHHMELLHDERNFVANEKGGYVLAMIIAGLMSVLFLALLTSP